MKITTTGLAMLFVGLAAGPVYAADGTLNFIGRVVNGACKLEGRAITGSSTSAWAIFRCRD